MACPQCITALDVIEFETEPPLRIERCTTCHGMFFNPGEIEAALDTQTNPLVWLDPVQIQQIADDFGPREREIAYQKCPMCEDRMSHINFGGHSGVIIDRCGAHGIWLEGGELRRLTEWWRAGGKLIYQQNEANRVKQLYGTTARSWPIGSPQAPDQGTWGVPDLPLDPAILIDVIASAASLIFDD